MIIWAQVLQQGPRRGLPGGSRFSDSGVIVTGPDLERETRRLEVLVAFPEHDAFSVTCRGVEVIINVFVGEGVGDAKELDSLDDGFRPEVERREPGKDAAMTEGFRVHSVNCRSCPTDKDLECPEDRRALAVGVDLAVADTGSADFSADNEQQRLSIDCCEAFMEFVIEVLTREDNVRNKVDDGFYSFKVRVVEVRGVEG